MSDWVLIEGRCDSTEKIDCRFSYPDLNRCYIYLQGKQYSIVRDAQTGLFDALIELSGYSWHKDKGIGKDDKDRSLYVNVSDLMGQTEKIRFEWLKSAPVPPKVEYDTEAYKKMDKFGVF